MNYMNVDLKVDWRKERADENDNNNGKYWGIYTYNVPKDELDTDEMFNNSIDNVLKYANHIHIED